MLASTRIAALRAAAKVALFTTATTAAASASSPLGCASTTAEDPLAETHESTTHTAERASSRSLPSSSQPTSTSALTSSKASATIGLTAPRDAAVDAALAVAREDAALTTGPCAGETTDLDGSVRSATYLCCASFLEGQLANASDGLPALSKRDPEVRECCASALAFVDHGGYAEFLKSGARAETAVRACCEVLSTENGPPEGAACTPWGPPAPPAMPSLADLGVS